jgi:NADPH2:quinone reductase
VRAAVLTSHDAPPQLAIFAPPVARTDREVVVQVAAAGINHVDLAKASGRFYTGPPPLPSVVGTDGVGRLPDGARVYFDTCVPPYGALAEQVLVDHEECLQVAEGIDDALAAALGNSGLAAWIGLEWRAKLHPGETVLVLGASGAVGTVAVQAARILGAGRVVAVVRRSDSAAAVRDLGADEVIAADDCDDLVEAISSATRGGHHVALDPVWGEHAVAAMRAACHGTRHVQVGHIAGLEAAVPASIVRARALDIHGFGVLHAPHAVRAVAYLRLTTAAVQGDVTLNVTRLALDAIDAAWHQQQAGPANKLVITFPT